MSFSALSPSPSPAPKIKVQIYSDLHLEMNGPIYTSKYASRSLVYGGTRSGDLPSLAPYLFLAGDIGSLVIPSHQSAFETWLANQCAKHTYVFYVAGNHEFFGRRGGVDAGIAEMRRLSRLACMGGRLVCLENERFDIPGAGVSVLGCVLWSRIVPAQTSLGRLADVGSISGTSIEEHTARFERSYGFIKEAVRDIRAEGGERRIVVLTHYCPLMVGSTRFEFRGSWSNWQTDILGGEGVEGLGEGDTWIHGHTHFSHESWQDGVRVLSNSRGNSMERTRFEWDRVFEI
ncbi:uncharacterized protein RAG0_01101 [Rhynchosporium agropyri]|uniref:Calcineurin-like phosphoesterase domain-containing protein n=1 Tax=Rhynchosporium agropyri TaxID=914238 RepID=A0A1E1JVE4_9HELO|nr:uncharacterized protein RAG0_01101 [Rhynchosporium agropyri]